MQQAAYDPESAAMIVQPKPAWYSFINTLIHYAKASPVTLNALPSGLRLYDYSVRKPCYQKLQLVLWWLYLQATIGLPLLQSPVAHIHEVPDNKIHSICHCDFSYPQGCFIYRSNSHMYPPGQQVFTVHNTIQVSGYGYADAVVNQCRNYMNVQIISDSLNISC